MGYMRHHAIVVTTFTRQMAEKAHEEARDIFKENPSLISPLQRSAANDYYSFFIGPDGSKEGWDTSDDGDRNREEFISWLVSKRHDDGDEPYAWAEVQYGDDEHVTCITRDSDEASRARARAEATEPLPQPSQPVDSLGSVEELRKWSDELRAKVAELETKPPPMCPASNGYANVTEGPCPVCQGKISPVRTSATHEPLVMVWPAHLYTRHTQAPAPEEAKP